MHHDVLDQTSKTKNLWNIVKVPVPHHISTCATFNTILPSRITPFWISLMTHDHNLICGYSPDPSQEHPCSKVEFTLMGFSLDNVDSSLVSLCCGPLYLYRSATKCVCLSSVNFILEYYITRPMKPALTLLLQHFLVLGRSELLKNRPSYNVIATKKLCNVTQSNIQCPLSTIMSWSQNSGKLFL